MDDGKSPIKKIFQFLKEFNKLKTKPLLNIKSYPQVLWFYEIPKEEECYVITRHIQAENTHYNKWIEIKKPKRTSYPEPPEEIKPWLKEGVLNQYTKEPQLFSYIISEPENDFMEHKNFEEEEENKKILLENCPEVKKSFEDYIRQKWWPWSQEEQRLETVSKVYNRFYEMYKKNKNQGEVYQIVLGLGFLCSKNRQGKDIKRHIVTAPATIDFHSATGKITVKPAEQDVELSLEMDMFRESEKPDNCGSLNNQLSELNNDFWKTNLFYNHLKSWLNSHNSSGQFYNRFDKPSSSESFTTLTVSPAVILRKRNERAFIKFYDSVIKDMESKVNLSPCFKHLIDKPSTHHQKEISPESEKKVKPALAEKHYFPLPTNAEQEKIIDKVLYHNQVVVQGPPGTGKTHSIANLICHFLAKGKKIIVTSQTDRALRVLRNKLPEEIKLLCIEILGKDQQSFQELKDSFSAINEKYQNWSDSNINNTQADINQLEDKDNQLEAELAKIKNQLMDLKRYETKQYEKLFDFYTGTPAVIASHVKEEEKQYSWIKEFFDTESSVECPVSNKEAKEFFIIIKNLKNIDDSVLKESVEFLDNIFTPQQLEEKIKAETQAGQTIEQHKSYESKESTIHYNPLNDIELNQLQGKLAVLKSKVESLLNKNEEWITRALNDCLADKDRAWRYLYDFTNKTLDEHREIFQSAEELKNIKAPSHLNSNDDLKVQNLLKDFFDKYQSDEQVPWKWYQSKPKMVRELKEIKINDKKISSYEDVKEFRNYVIAKNVQKKLNNYWKNQGVKTNLQRPPFFSKNYHILKDLLEPVEECLSAHKLTEDIKKILSPKNISLPQWTKDSIKEIMELVEYIQAQNVLEKIKQEFKKTFAILKPYEQQKNQFAKDIMVAYKSRDITSYKDILNKTNDFKIKQKHFSRLCEIRKKLNNNNFYKKLNEDIKNPVWESQIMSFEKAWAWQRANQWLKEQTSEEFVKKLNQEKEELREQQKNNMEKLVSKKAWSFCLSNLKDSELSSLKGWIQSISKMGKGTGITAGKHRKTAKKRMEECKTAIPAWIMPLYRVVENINPANEPFDIAIIDEASQTGPDGFLLNHLAKKIIVVGDKEQISPENPGIKDEDVEIHKKKYLSDIKFFDYIGREYSYYDYCETLFTKSHVQLREHFRCMPEIIQFSNSISYSGTPLIPLRQYGSSRLTPLKTTYVRDAISQVGSGKDPQNEKEAKAIVAQIKKCISDPAYDGKTFGVIVLQGKAQIQVIESALSEIDKKDLEERRIHVGNAYNFQGDERDVIFLSMAVAKDRSISALTRETYKKMYNVAGSRAKDQMWLFHSVERNDLSSEDYRRKLLSHCKSDSKQITAWPQNELEKLYRKIKETQNKKPENAPELFSRPNENFGSWFEARVFHKIALKGYQVIPQFKVSHYRIDMVIVGSKGRLALECDGDYWHSGEKKEMEDQDRQGQLERCGWTFWRLRESVFNRDEESALKSLWERLDKMKIYPLRT